ILVISLAFYLETYVTASFFFIQMHDSNATTNEKNHTIKCKRLHVFLLKELFKENKKIQNESILI
uniref:hypothetical protein n=1 Tax=Enterococcus gilvus TaxID=160453 RepID=UPI0028D2988E